jgi:outer membrane immunogenic protein
MRMPVYKAPPMDPWSGVYAGINIGQSFGAWDASSNQRIFNFESMTASPKLNGAVFGGQVGFNARANGIWVWGLEGDFQITRERASQNWSDPELPINFGETFDFVPRAGGPATLSHNWEFPWFGTLRLRAGVTPADNWLIYATGGLAVGEVRYAFAFSQPGAAANFPPTATDYALSRSDLRVGYAIGAGTEIKLDRYWSVKLEYLLVDLGKVSIDTVDIDGSPFHVEYRALDQIVRIGVNYQLWGLRP